MFAYWKIWIESRWLDYKLSRQLIDFTREFHNLCWAEPNHILKRYYWEQVKVNFLDVC